MTELEDKVVELIKREGPLLPIRVSKELGVETYLAGAILSTLFARKRIKMSFRKIGSSPLYYVEGQEEKVREMLRETLNPLEEKVLERMRELRVALDEELYPQERFLLKELRDFVDQVTVKLENGSEITCWKLKEVSEEELEEILTKKLKLEKEEEKEESESKEEEREIVEEKHIGEVKPKREKKRRTKVNWNEYIERLIQYGLTLEKEVEVKSNEFIAIFEKKGEIPQKFYVAILKKKNASMSDLSKIFVEANSEKMPAIVFVNNVSKKTEELSKKMFGELLKIIKI